MYPLPSFTPPTPLAKGALSFAVHSSVHKAALSDVEGGADSADGAGLTPTTVTQLVIGCRRKVIIHSWKDGQIQKATVRLRYIYWLPLMNHDA